ncbi:mfs multidrug [Fusarium langsethiae]|uniref:Mfs multidrug n=1 Tax=Fusarium langsethiae TaxID=179993 RepID=A0A0M9F0D3_FUSLA|nr:mfs multidrug [Fusarium langsethiae]
MTRVAPKEGRSDLQAPLNENEKTVSSSNTPTLHEPAQEEIQAKPEVELPAEQEEGENQWLTGWKLASMMTSLTLAAFLMLLDMSIISTAIPRITSDFHSLHDIGWYASAYNLASAALQPLTGKLYMYFNTRWIFLSLFFVFELGNLICGIAQSSTMLIIGRAISGIGSSGIQNGALTIIATAVPIHKRPSLVGILMGVAQLGIVSGPLVGGAFTQYTTWRWCFYINLPIGAICTVLILIVHIPNHRAATDETVMHLLKTKFDFTGLVMFNPSVVMLLLALQWGGVDYAWDSATIIGLFCGGGVLFAMFIVWEHRVGTDAMIPMPIVRTRQVWTSCLTQLFLFATVMVASFYLPVYFQSAKDASPFTSGVNLLPSILMLIVAAVSSGALVQKIGYYIPFAASSAIISAIGFGLASTMGPYTSTAKWAGYQILIGFGRGLGLQMPIIAVQANTKPEVTPIAMSILTFSQTFGSAIFVTAANVIFTHELREELISRLPSLDPDMIIDAGAGANHFATMNRPNRSRNRQPRPPRQEQNNPRGGSSRPSRAPGTPQQAAGTVPKVHQVIPGASVFIILKEDQPTGEETKGVVQDVLTRGNHPRGIKVRLRDGQVGRVQRMGNTSEATTAPSDEPRAQAASSSSRFTMRYTDVRRDDEFATGPPPRSLADFIPDFEENSTNVPIAGVETVKCPFCDKFEGDEAAVTHHIDREHLS